MKISELISATNAEENVKLSYEILNNDVKISTDTRTIKEGDFYLPLKGASFDGEKFIEQAFEKGAIGALHQHPHTQITYVVSGKFEFEIDGVKKTVCAGDSMLKTDSVIHGCVCLEDGILLDIFNLAKYDV